ncbi:MAG: hypothetical protein P4L56_28625 [Candidatus Sulfopaludibacter sp.]|nr:hypothetical protein [Candidatus Sulfopaludibacter sp.]
MNKARTLPAALPLLLAVLFFLSFAYPGLRAYFTGDDFMNLQKMHGYFTTPVARVALEVFNPLSSSYRPMGGLFYRALYAAVGFHPLPFRCACFALLIVNLLLAYRLLRFLSGSTEAALLGTLVFSYHAEMYGLYFNTGTIYDILCFTFFTLALLLYVRYRREFGGLPWQAWAGLMVLDLLALQSKEMAWTLPAILLLYEVLYFWRARRSRLPGSVAPALATGLLTLLPLFPRILGRTGLTSSPLYHPNLSPGYFLANCAHYWSLIFYAPDRIGVTLMLAMWTGMALSAAFFRSRAMGFGLLFWMIGIAPVAVIQPRAGYVLYLPMLGLALYAGVLASRLREFVTASRVSQVCLFGLLAAGLAFAHARHRAVYAGTVAVQSETRGLVVQLRRMHPTLARKAHVLFVEDPFADEWLLEFLFRLLYDDPDLWVDSAALHPHARTYEYVFRYAGGKLEELPPRLSACTPQTLPAGLTDDTSPLLCWDGDWITQRFPQPIGGTLTYAGDAGATARVAFRGTTLEYLCTRAFNRGLVDIAIDGVPRGTLDLYSRDTVWQAPFRFDGLSPGEHTAVLRVLGRHNPAATDSIVDVDAFRVQ